MQVWQSTQRGTHDYRKRPLGSDGEICAEYCRTPSERMHASRLVAGRLQTRGGAGWAANGIAPFAQLQAVVGFVCKGISPQQVC